MKKIIVLFYSLLFICVLFLPNNSLSQNVGIGTTAPNASALVDITSTNRGFLLPRMGSAAIAAITTPAKGLMVYDSVKNQLMVNMGTPASPNWQTIVAGSGWALTGNSGINPVAHFIGTGDSNVLRLKCS